MDVDEFRKWGKRMIDYIADYWTMLPSRRPKANVNPGYIRQLLPDEPPENGESFEKIFSDLETVIMEGITHWHHPRFFAYFPTANSFPAIIGDILSSGIGSIGFTWASSPAYTELELAMMDWLAKLVGLPDEFLYSSEGPGAGVIQGTASECVYLAMLAAKKQATNNLSDQENESSLIAYASDQAHSSVQKAALMIGVRLRLVESDKLRRMTSEALQGAVEEDKKKGLVPFFVRNIQSPNVRRSVLHSAQLLVALLTAYQKLGHFVSHKNYGYMWTLPMLVAPQSVLSTGGFLRVLSILVRIASLRQIGKVENTKLTEYLYYRMKDTRKIEHTFFVNPQYLKHDQQGVVPDLRNWQVALGRRFRSLKVWFTIRAFGAEKLRENFRKMCRLAEYFASLVQKDQNFEIVQPVVLGVICFRIKGSNEINEKAAKIINDKGDIYFSAVTLHDLHVLRLCICSTMTEKSDVDFAWEQIKEVANLLLKNGKDAAQR